MATLMQVFNATLTASFVDKNPENKSVFTQAGVFVSDPRITPYLSQGAGDIKIPHLLEPDYNLESNYSNTIYNDIAIPRELAFGTSNARVAYLNEGWVESALATELTGVSPNALIAARINKYWTKQLELRAIASAFGVYNANAKNTDIVTVSTKVFDIDSFIDATATLGNAGLMVVNSKVKSKMRKDQMLVPFTDPTNLNTVDTYNGYTVEVNDKLTTLAGGKYLTMIFDKAAIVAESVANVRDLRTESSESRGNGGGVDTLWTRRNMVVHPQGYDFTSAVITGGTKNEALSPSLTDLADASNWALKGNATDTAIRFLINIA